MINASGDNCAGLPDTYSVICVAHRCASLLTSSITNMEPKITDVMVLGATGECASPFHPSHTHGYGSGFTGRLVARHLGAHPDFASEVFTFSLAGRSVDRIQQVRKDLGIDSDKVPIVQVDVLNDADVNAAVRTTKVVIDVVGPYWKWGKVVARLVQAFFPSSLGLLIQAEYSQGLRWSRRTLRGPDRRAELHEVDS
jgi:hypothetical protein